MMSHRVPLRSVRQFLTIGLIVTLAGGVPVSGATTPLGTMRGFGAAKVSIDADKSWLRVGAHAFPVLEGADLRTTTGGAALDLADGSRVNVLPFSAVRFGARGQATQLSVSYGRLTFRFPELSRVEILTRSAKLEPVPQARMAGEVVVSGAGAMGLKMSQGALRVARLDNPRLVLLASREPVFLPKRPAVTGPMFSSDMPLAVPSDAKAVFAPDGHSIGYLTPGGSNFTISPGFTSDLTRPFSSRLVQLAMAKIPDPDVKNDAMPLFDVNGQYGGYVSGPEFYPQNSGGTTASQAAPVQRTAAAGQATGSTGAMTAMPLGSVGVTAGLGPRLAVSTSSGLVAAPDKCNPHASPHNPHCK